MKVETQFGSPTLPPKLFVLVFFAVQRRIVFHMHFLLVFNGIYLLFRVCTVGFTFTWDFLLFFTRACFLKRCYLSSSVQHNIICFLSFGKYCWYFGFWSVCLGVEKQDRTHINYFPFCYCLVDFA